MTREELENRSKSELIDLVLQQQAQLAQLQLAARGNGAGQAAGAPDVAGVEVGRFPRALKVMLFAAAAFACALIVLVIRFKPATPVSVGRVADFPSGSVTALRLPASNPADPAVAIFLVNDSTAGFLALSRQAPNSNCQVDWQAGDQHFVEPCGGSTFSRSGEPISGPAARGLDRFPVTVDETGEVHVDVNRLLSGP